MTARKKPAPAKKTARAGKDAAKTTSTPPKKKKTGRPSAYSEALATEICERLANKESMRQICLDPRMPHRTTVQEWIARDPAFATRCARAREEQADYIVEDCASIEDRTIAGEINPAAARAVLASKQWRAAKLAPKKYGDKLQLGGADDLAPLQGGSVTVNNTIEIPPAEAYAKMLSKGG